MSDDPLQVDVAAWIDRAGADAAARRERQAVEIVLHSLAKQPDSSRFYLKGGFLMGLVHGSPRHTSDIDLTADVGIKPGMAEKIAAAFNETLPGAAADLGHTGFSVAVHSVKKLPKRQFDRASFPALRIKLAHGPLHLRGRPGPGKPPAVSYFNIDISFNEPRPGTVTLEIAAGRQLLAYALADLIAEKYRAVLQQVPRRRERRQDIYDLHYLTTGSGTAAAIGSRILEAMLEKCRARGIEPRRGAMDDPEIRRRSEANWDSLELELGDLPAFGQCFAQVKRFYESLPWSG